MKILIRGGRVIDPGSFDGPMDLLIDGGHIAQWIPPEGPIESNIDRVLDVSGLLVVPGFIDMHVHLREPGFEKKETIQTGCRSAAYGGITAVCAMPNSLPVNDSPEITRMILDKALKAGSARVYPVAAISRESHGEALTDFDALKAAGAVAVSDDGLPVMNSRLMRQALESAGRAGLVVISHAEDIHLAQGGAMNEGEVAHGLGYPGNPNASESIMVMRDIALSELTGAPLHIAHVSTRESVRAIRQAKSRDIRVTAETAPHYFTLTDSAVESAGTHAKMNPPLRSEKDREAIRSALADGTLDAIATDHAPHTPQEKARNFISAPNGIIGLETSVSLGLALVREGILPLQRWIELMATNPARILGLETGLEAGKKADITVIDPDQTFKVDAEKFQSLSRNTPFNGWEMTGRAVLTVVGGRIVYEALGDPK